MKTAKFSRGQVIFAENAVETCMYDIVSGSVTILAGYKTDNEKELAVLEAGASFGEMGMIENLPRSATAIANNYVELNVIEAEDFSEYFKDKPAKVLNIIRNTSGRMRALTADYIDACGCIAQYCKCEENGEKISKELMEKLTKLSFIGKK
ncbi:MAG: cyclic nucleotide-binding domain-containing protein [Ruminococcus sp.]|nr:cyclic nucleotide-binding domain-containing protein [Candidatus Copronaster equi]